MWLTVAALAACGHAAAPAATTATVPKQVKLAVLPAESDAFPNAARTATQQMNSAHVAGIDSTLTSKVSLEVVQLSIECVDPTTTCYAAVGHSLAVDKLLFAQIGAGGKKGQVKIAITLFDVGNNAAKTGVEQVFASETEATAAIPELVTKATQP